MLRSASVAALHAALVAFHAAERKRSSASCRISGVSCCGTQAERRFMLRSACIVLKIIESYIHQTYIIKIT